MTPPTAPRSVNAPRCLQGSPGVQPAPVSVGPLQEQVGGRTPRRRWSSRKAGSEDELLMVKSMLDLRMLDSFSALEDEQQEVPKLDPSLTPV